MEENQYRRACDRCHDHKLRCKRNGVNSCVRCLKARANCVFSPSLRARKSQPAPAADDEGGNQSVSLTALVNKNSRPRKSISMSGASPSAAEHLQLAAEPDGTTSPLHIHSNPQETNKELAAFVFGDYMLTCRWLSLYRFC